MGKIFPQFPEKICEVCFDIHKYSEIDQTITKYYFNLKLQNIILLLHIILLFVSINYGCKQYQTKEVITPKPLCYQRS